MRISCREAFGQEDAVLGRIRIWRGPMTGRPPAAIRQSLNRHEEKKRGLSRRERPRL